jgi:hypothetical protein
MLSSLKRKIMYTLLLSKIIFYKQNILLME